MNDGNAKEDGGFFVCFDRRTKGYKVFNSNQHRSKEHWKNLCAGVKTELTIETLKHGVKYVQS